MSEIKVQCIDQAISFLNTPVISSGNVNYDTISFDFCSRWDGYAKTAIFYRNKDEVYYQLLENDKCIIPNEVLGEKGVIYLGVFGTQGDKTITSQVLTYRIQEGAVTEDLKPSDPTPDIYAQLVGRFADFANELTDQQAKLDEFEVRFNGSVGDAEKLGGQMPDYYATAQSVTDLVNGATPVGNANKLGGLTSEKFPRYLGKVTDIAFINNTSTNYPYICEVDTELAEQLGLSKTYWVIEYYPYHTFNGYGIQKAIPLDPYTKDENPMWRNSAGVTWFPWSYYDGGDADTVDGFHAYQLQEVGSDGLPIAGHYITFQHNVNGDNRFNAVTNTGHEVSVNHANYATNADTVDGKHASDFLSRAYETKSGIDLLATAEDTTICPNSRATRFRAFSPTNAPFESGDFFIEVQKLDNSWIKIIATTVRGNYEYTNVKVNGLWFGWKCIALADEVLPLDGSVPMSGSLGLNVNGGGFRISPTNIQTQLVANGSATQGFRAISIVTHDYTANDADALKFGVYDGNTSADFIVLHTGNSAKVTITNSESDVPSEMSGLWAY